MALLGYTQIADVGTADTTVTPAGGGDTIPFDDRGFVEVNNGGGSGITVTVPYAAGNIHGQAVPSASVSVGAGARKKIRISADQVSPSTGVATITCSTTTSVTIGAYRV